MDEQKKVSRSMLNDLHRTVKRITHTPVRVMVSNNMLTAVTDVGTVTVAVHGGQWCVVFNRKHRCSDTWKGALRNIEELMI